MKAKYIREKLDGTFVYPPEPKEIKSREDLQRWFEWTSQFTEFNDYRSLKEKLHLPYTENIAKEEKIINIQFPKCTGYAKFYENECFAVSIN